MMVHLAAVLSTEWVIQLHLSESSPAPPLWTSWLGLGLRLGLDLSFGAAGPGGGAGALQ